MPISNEAEPPALRQKKAPVATKPALYYYLYIKIPVGKVLTDSLDSNHHTSQPHISLTELHWYLNGSAIIIF